MWRRGCARKEKHMEERMMDVIVEIYNHMDDSDKEVGREALAYDPQFFYDTIVELMEQDAE